MNKKIQNVVLLGMAALLVACGSGVGEVTVYPPAQKTDNPTKVVFVAGPDSHWFGEHEHGDGTELLAAKLRERQPSYEVVTVVGAWPNDELVFTDADAVVMYCDGGAGHVMANNLATVNKLIKQQVGIVALHYCVEVVKSSAAASTMLNAIGGYFETDWSVNPFWTAQYKTLPVHPITNGIEPFTLLDEWYFNMRFRRQGVTPILSAVPPAETMERDNGPHSGNDDVRTMVAAKQPQITAWAYQREDGGRGFGYTGGHYHKNWTNNDLTVPLILQAIEWVATDE